MNGGHDLGGMHGLGPIGAEPESEEPVFHAPWEKRVFALTLAAGALGKWNLDMSRHARERQLPADYIANSYYQNWLAGLSKLLVEQGVLSSEELESGRADGVATDVDMLRSDQVAAALARGGPASRPVEQNPAFEIGDAVRVRNIHPSGHTRVPRYVRNRSGIVAEQHGGHVFADANAHGQSQAQHLYSVAFTARELWGSRAAPSDKVYVDLWESHLEPDHTERSA